MADGQTCGCDQGDPALCNGHFEGPERHSLCACHCHKGAVAGITQPPPDGHVAKLKEAGRELIAIANEYRALRFEHGIGGPRDDEAIEGWAWAIAGGRTFGAVDARTARAFAALNRTNARQSDGNRSLFFAAVADLFARAAEIIQGIHF